MADEKEIKKKYYWLKLNEGFFRDKKMKKLRRIAGGDTYTIIYLKMQLLSLKDHGVLLYEGVEENFAEEVALEIDEEIDNVKVTISFLFNNGLLEEVGEDQYLLPETVKAIGSESSSAERVRRHRAKKKAKKLSEPSNFNDEEAPKLEKPLQSNIDETDGNTEIEIEKEIDIEIEQKLTDKQRDRVEFLRDLFVGWSVSDYQIYYLSFLVKERLPFDFSDSELKRDLTLYDAVQKLTMQARADDVKHIYRWAVKVIPYMEF